jgi:hypothetical protein
VVLRGLGGERFQAKVAKAPVRRVVRGKVGRPPKDERGKHE